MKILDRAKGEIVTFVDGKVNPATGSVGLPTQLGRHSTTVSVLANTGIKNKLIEKDIK